MFSLAMEIATVVNRFDQQHTYLPIVYYSDFFKF